MFERWVWVSSFLQKLVWRSFFFARSLLPPPLYILPPIQPGPLFQTTSEEKIAKAVRGEVETGDGFTGKERIEEEKEAGSKLGFKVRPPSFISIQPRAHNFRATHYFEQPFLGQTPVFPLKSLPSWAGARDRRRGGDRISGLEILEFVPPLPLHPACAWADRGSRQNEADEKVSFVNKGKIVQKQPTGRLEITQQTKQFPNMQKKKDFFLTLLQVPSSSGYRRSINHRSFASPFSMPIIIIARPPLLLPPPSPST